MKYSLKIVWFGSVLKYTDFFLLLFIFFSFQIHKELVASEDILIALLEELGTIKSWELLQEKMNFCKCVGNYFRSAVL